MRHYLINIIAERYNPEHTKQIDITCSFEDAKKLVETILSKSPPGTFGYIHIFDDYIDGYEEHVAHIKKGKDWVIW